MLYKNQHGANLTLLNCVVTQIIFIIFI